MNSFRRLSITGSTLKLLAVIAMLVDHVGVFVFRNNDAFLQVFCTIGSKEITTYFLMRAIGRIAFPIFAFLVVEGFIHTRNRFKYGRNLLLFAVLSELPWNFIHAGTWHYPGQNVFFTLFLGYMGLCCLFYWKEETVKKGVGLLFLLAVSFKLHADYGYRGFAFILMLYALYDSRLLKSVIGCCMLPGAWMAGLAFIPIALYNGERGFIQDAWGKYFIYAFYPLHLTILYLYKVVCSM